jgi:hypothetical protein
MMQKPGGLKSGAGPAATSAQGGGTPGRAAKQ